MRELLVSFCEAPTIYRAWQAPFAAAKIRPFLLNTSMNEIRRVLDLGCGPGTNAPLFSGKDYVGLDLNPRYIDEAKSRHKGTFVACDIAQGLPGDLGKFDCVLINSLFHHLADADVTRVLRAARDALSPDGRVHVLDLVVPEEIGLQRFFAKADRGEHARSLDHLLGLLKAVFTEERRELYSLKLLGLKLYRMLYFTGRL